MLEAGGRTRRIAAALLTAISFAVSSAAPGAWAQSAGARDALARLPQYRITADVDPAAHQLSVDTHVRLPATTAPRDAVVFALRRDMGRPRVSVPGGGGRATPAPVRELAAEAQGPDTRWEVRLPRPAPAGEPLALRIQHRGGKEIGLNFYIGPEGSFVGGGTTAWYPQFDGQRGAGRLSVTVPKTFSVVATALRGAATTKGARRTMEFTAGWPTHFGFTAGPYQVHRMQGRAPTSIYLLKDRPFRQELGRVAQRALEVLEREYGPYPYGEFAVVEAPAGPAQKSGIHRRRLRRLHADAQRLDGRKRGRPRVLRP